MFGVKSPSDEPKFPLSTKRPKTDAIRYSYLIYTNRHRGSNWDIALWLEKHEQKRGYFLELFGMIDEKMEFMKGKKLLLKDLEDSLDAGKTIKRDINPEVYQNRLKKNQVNSKIGRYKNEYAPKYLTNVCKGQFP